MSNERFNYKYKLIMKIYRNTVKTDTIVISFIGIR